MGDEEFQGVLKTIDDAIIDEKQASSMYAALSQQLIDSEQRAIVEGIARDELRHYRSLTEVKMEITPEMIKSLPKMEATAIDRIAEAVVEKIKDALVSSREILADILEHEATGAGRVIDAAKAKATPCKCFTVEEDGFEACWSPGILGLMTSKKNPEQIREFCALGKEPAGAGARERFKKIRGAISEAHKRWEEKGGGLPEWWEEVGKTLEEHKIEL